MHNVAAYVCVCVRTRVRDYTRAFGCVPARYIDERSIRMAGRADKLLDRTLHTLAPVILNPTHYTLRTTATYHPSGHYSDLNCLSCDFTGLPRNLPNPFLVGEVSQPQVIISGSPTSSCRGVVRDNVRGMEVHAHVCTVSTYIHERDINGRKKRYVTETLAREQPT